MAEELHPYAPLILKLLQGVVYYDDKLWELLISYRNPITRHFAAIGLRLYLDDVEGYAYLTQPEAEGGQMLPRLVRRRSLSYEATLLCVVLREALQQFDAQEPDQARFVMTRNEIRDLMLIFYAEQSNMTRLDDRIDRAIRQVEEVSFLKKLASSDEHSYEVRRIIKAKISADVLVSVRQQLEKYRDEQRGMP